MHQVAREEKNAAALDRIAEVVNRFGFDCAALATENIRDCNLCGGTSGEFIQCLDRYCFPVGLFVCWQCGLIQLAPRMSADSYREFYERGIYRALGTALVNRSQDNEMVKRIQEKYAAALIDHGDEFLKPKRGGTYLDIGGSVGLMAATLAERYGLRATVLDPATGELADVPANIHRECGIIETWADDGRTFDVITMMQTVDHLLDVRHSLERIRRLLAPGGLFIVDAVNYMAIAKARGTIRAALKIDHVYSLTEATMGAYLLRAGFTIEKSLSMKDHTKLFYFCRAGERVKAFPPRPSVWQTVALLYESMNHETVRA